MIKNTTNQQLTAGKPLLQTDWYRTWGWAENMPSNDVIVVTAVALSNTAPTKLATILDYLTEHQETVTEAAQHLLHIDGPLQLFGMHVTDTYKVRNQEPAICHLLFRTSLTAANLPTIGETVGMPYNERKRIVNEDVDDSAMRSIGVWYNCNPHVPELLKKWAAGVDGPDELLHLLMHKQAAEGWRENVYAANSRTMCPYQTRDYLAGAAIRGYLGIYLRDQARQSLQMYGEMHNDQLYSNTLIALSRTHLFKTVEELYQAADAVCANT